MSGILFSRSMKSSYGQPGADAFPDSGTAPERPKKSLIHERFLKEKDSVIESAMGKQESWAKKVGNGLSGVLLDDMPKFIDALGLKVVPKEARCIDARVYEAYRTLAAAAMNEPEKLKWDGDE